MSRDTALVERTRPQLLAARARELLAWEAEKGCSPTLALGPVALEPAYRPVAEFAPLAGRLSEAAPEPEVPPPLTALRRLEAWVSPQQCCDWLRGETFVKQLADAEWRIAFELVGNQDGVALQFLYHADDADVLRAAFGAQFERCELAPLAPDPGVRGHDGPDCLGVFLDFFPPPPYSHLFTQPGELKRSPLAGFITTLAHLPAPALGWYQVVFQGVAPAHNWHQNVQVLLDLEYAVKLMSGLVDPRRYAQQAPSGDLRHMSADLELKAHNDKRFFAAAVRIGVFHGGPEAEGALRALGLVTTLVQHGGRPLCALRETAYGGLGVTPWELFCAGLTYRPGFLANSAELTTFVHLPPPEALEHIRRTPLKRLETLPPVPALAEGTPIGQCIYAGEERPVCIPLDQRTRHCFIVGPPGHGKSELIKRMVLADAAGGAGLAVLDPHGDLVKELLTLLPAAAAEQVIYLNPGDRDWVPLWNPLTMVTGQDAGWVADDLVSAFKSVMDGWGDRLENILRQTLFGLLHLPQSSLLDAAALFRPKSPQNQALRSAIFAAVDNPEAREYWRQDHGRYGKDDFGPPRHKLSKLLLAGTVALMLSQPECAFNLREIMDQGNILLIDLSQVGAQVRSVLGCLILALLNLSALSRSQTPATARRAFHIYVDEGHFFRGDAIEEIIAQARKFNVSLTLASQYLRQFSAAQVDALLTMNSTIAFRLEASDAQQVKKTMCGLVEADDLIKLEKHQAIARIDTHVVRFRTVKLPVPPGTDQSAAIIQRSRARYYRPVQEIRAQLRARWSDWNNLAESTGQPPPERSHDVFD